jgi:hypothetical protein
MKLKVYGGLTFENGKQVRTIVATKSKKRVSELVGVDYRQVLDYWCETGNDMEIATAISQPNVVFKATASLGKAFAVFNK